MRKNYTEPKIRIAEFDAENILTASEPTNTAYTPINKVGGETVDSNKISVQQGLEFFGNSR